MAKSLWVLICICNLEREQASGDQGEGRSLRSPGSEGLDKTEWTPEVIQVLSVTRRASADPLHGRGRAEKGRPPAVWKHLERICSKAHLSTCIVNKGERWRLMGWIGTASALP